MLTAKSLHNSAFEKNTEIFAGRVLTPCKHWIVLQGSLYHLWIQIFDIRGYMKYFSLLALSFVGET